MNATARSVTWFVDELLRGPIRAGVGMGHGLIKFGPYIVTVTPPGGPRMPNGIECELDVNEGELVSVGNGALRKEGIEVVAGPMWDARPHPRVVLDASPADAPDAHVLLGEGTGLTPQGDDVLIGYLAGRTVFGLPVNPAVVSQARRRTTTLSSTLLFHATRGELPEPAHSLLENGDPAPLLGFGHSSGRALLLGLALAHPRDITAMMPPVHVTIVDGIPHLPRTTVRIFKEPAAYEIQADPDLALVRRPA